MINYRRSENSGIISGLDKIAQEKVLCRRYNFLLQNVSNLYLLVSDKHSLSGCITAIEFSLVYSFITSCIKLHVIHPSRPAQSC